MMRLSDLIDRLMKIRREHGHSDPVVRVCEVLPNATEWGQCPRLDADIQHDAETVLLIGECED